MDGITIETKSLAKSRWTPILTGVVIFLISEFFLFGALFFTYYYLRSVSQPWPPSGVHLDMGRPIANTVILLASSAVIYMGVRAARRGNWQRAGWFLVITLSLGVMFLGITVWEWLQETFRPWSSAYGSIFYTLTGFHALHVFGGIMLLTALHNRIRHNRFSTGNYQAIELGSIYWHYVDFIWILVFITLFIVR
jgi:cytochrome c oxidase subunit 3